MTGDPTGGRPRPEADHRAPARDDAMAPPAGGDPTLPSPGSVPITVSLNLVWRIGLVLLAVVAAGLMARFVISDAGHVIFTVLMSWFAALAMAPVVNRLARRMRRGAATGLVMAGAAALGVVFLVAFGALFVDQMEQLLRQVPDLVDQALEWANRTFSLSLTRDGVPSSVQLDPEQLAALAAAIGAGLLGFLGSAVGGLFSIFTFGMFVFYLSAQMPQLERWIASLFPARSQAVAATVWTLTAQKTGGYVGARVVLALVNAVTTAIVFVAIGMPYWLPLALWTGVVAQFIPTIGTYIAIVLPVVVGLLSPDPWLGVIALVWAVAYQQVENLFIEPRVSAKAVDVNPAVSFGAVLLGAALFGTAGAFLAVPVVAMLLSLLNIYGHRHEILPEIEEAVARSSPPPPAEPDRGRRTRRGPGAGVEGAPRDSG